MGCRMIWGALLLSWSALGLQSGAEETATRKVQEWPHFLGPDLNATTAEAPLLEKWPEDGLPLLWEQETGDGYTCPVIADGRLFYFHRVDGKERIECRDPKTGELVWSHGYEVDYRDRYGFSPGPRASVVVDGDHIFSAGVTARIHCLEAATGKVVWERDLVKDYKVPQYFFGYGPTPLVVGDALMVNVGGKPEGADRGVCVAAFDKRTGKMIWEVEDEWGASYASPVPATIAGRSCVLVLAAGESRPSVGGLLTIDAESGEVYDRFPWRARKYESVLASPPLVLKNGRVFISECYEKGGVLLEFDGEGKSRVVWTQREFGMHFMMPLEIDGYLYGFAGRNPPDTEFKCVDAATGELKWTKSHQWTVDGWVEGLFRGSLLKAGERCFALGEDGVFVELELSPEGSKEVQKTRLFTAREAWTLPSLHDGLLYVVQNSTDSKTGTKPRILCYDLRPQ